MAGVSPWHINIPKLKPIKPVVGPQNVGLPGYRPGDAGNPYPAAPAAPAPPAAPAAPAAPPAPIDFNALALTDPEYTTGQQRLGAQNTLTLESLLKGYKQTSQGYQDQANSRGALFSGAAVNAQKYAAQQYADQQRQQALNLGQSDAELKRAVFNRLIQQLAGGQ